MKKFLSVVLALTMALALAVPAFASGTTDIGLDGLAEGATIEVTGETKTANVKVTVPTTSKVVLNPYELSYEVSQGNTDTHQIISAPQYIVNESDLPVKVSTTVTGTIEGTGEFQAGDATAVTDKKAVHLVFNIGATTAKDTEPGTYGETKALAKTATAFNDITMDKKAGANPAIAFKFTGDAAKNPTTPWTTDDIIGATIAFTFALDNSGAGGGGGSTVTATITSDATGNLNSSTANSANLTVALSDSKTVEGVAWTIVSGDSVTLGTATGTNNDTMPVSYAKVGTTKVQAVVTYDTTQTATATFDVVCD